MKVKELKKVVREEFKIYDSLYEEERQLRKLEWDEYIKCINADNRPDKYHYYESELYIETRRARKRKAREVKKQAEKLGLILEGLHVDEVSMDNGSTNPEDWRMLHLMTLKARKDMDKWTALNKKEEKTFKAMKRYCMQTVYWLESTMRSFEWGILKSCTNIDSEIANETDAELRDQKIKLKTVYERTFNDGFGTAKEQVKKLRKGNATINEARQKGCEIVGKFSDEQELLKLKVKYPITYKEHTKLN